MTHDNNPPAEQPEAAHAAVEQEPIDRPQIWVGSLSDYNNGILYGQWMAADRQPEDIHSDIHSLLAESPTAAKYGELAEEWGIFDYEGFGNYSVGEYENIDVVARIARGVAEHGQAFAAWANLTGADPDQLDQFEEAFLGRFDSIGAWIDGLIDDLGYEDLLDQAVPSGIRPYVHVDGDQLATDMQLGGDVSVASAPDGGVWIFDNRI